MRNIAAWSCVLLTIISIVFAYISSERDGYAHLESESANRLDLYVAGLESELEKSEFLPSLIEIDADVLALMNKPGSTTLLDKVNKKLTNYTVRSGSSAIYILDNAGIVRAASNWYQTQSLIGKDFSSENYFSDALSGLDKRFFINDSPRNLSEYCFAEPIRENGKILGVAVVTISLDPIESTWIGSSLSDRNERLLLVNDNGLVIMSSLPNWKFKTTDLTSHLVRSAKTVRAADSLINPLDIIVVRRLEHGDSLVKLSNSTANSASTQYVEEERAMPQYGGSMIILSDSSDVFFNACRAALGAGAISGFFGLLAMYLLQRWRITSANLRSKAALQRAHDELELRINERTAELQQKNIELVHEIVERTRMEEVLREAQDELVQATKMAMLGQMSAGINHEINQPLTALRALSYNTRQLLKRGNIEKVDSNLQSIHELTERVIRITAQLKSFARKMPMTNGPVLLANAIENTLVLMENRFRLEKIDLEVDIASSLTVFCDNNRLEQVLLNLFSNACDAMKDASQKTLSIQATVVDGRALIRVTDSGLGISEATMRRLFEPFFSTKPHGEGLGLGLVISAGILREFGGILRTVAVPHGAMFEFDLGLSEEHLHV
jgi:two-component system C4-dicarboxylate transport sensor histidine kinase DctB